jgi:hypothetical protein
MRVRKKTQGTTILFLLRSQLSPYDFACLPCCWCVEKIMMELKHLIVGLAIAFLSYIILGQQRSKTGIQEPPSLRTKIPFIGHIIGFAIHGMRYFGKAWYVLNPTPSYQRNQTTNLIVVY